MTDTFALEAVVSAAPYSNIHVRANNPAELSERLDGLAEALDKVRVLAAEGNLNGGGIGTTPVDKGRPEKQDAGWGNSGDGNSGADNSPAQATGTQSYSRQKPSGGNSQYPDRVYLDIPFSAAADRQRAKGMGARFDGDKKQWYSTPKFAGENHDALVQEFGA